MTETEARQIKNWSVIYSYVVQPQDKFTFFSQKKQDNTVLSVKPLCCLF